MLALFDNITGIPVSQAYGRVHSVQRLLGEIGGPVSAMSVGCSRLRLRANGGQGVLCEAVGFREGRALATPFASVEWVGLGTKAPLEDSAGSVRPTSGWLGRIVNALGESLDGKAPLPRGPLAYALRNSPPPAQSHALVGASLDLGVRAIRLGAYHQGASAEVDETIYYQPALDAFLNQAKYERTSMEDGFEQLAQLLSLSENPSDSSDLSESPSETQMGSGAVEGTQ
jgi:flagellar biosynthesis/type III secretory pathway ATPase